MTFCGGAVELLRSVTEQYPLEAQKAPAYLARCYLSLGKCYESLGLEDKALESFSNAITCNGNLTEAFERRGFAYLGIGDRLAACKDLAVVLQRADSKNLEDIKEAWDEHCKHRGATHER